MQSWTPNNILLESHINFPNQWSYLIECELTSPVQIIAAVLSYCSPALLLHPVAFHCFHLRRSVEPLSISRLHVWRCSSFGQAPGKQLLTLVLSEQLD